MRAPARRRGGEGGLQGGLRPAFRRGVEGLRRGRADFRRRRGRGRRRLQRGRESELCSLFARAVAGGDAAGRREGEEGGTRAGGAWPEQAAAGRRIAERSAGRGGIAGAGGGLPGGGRSTA